MPNEPKPVTGERIDSFVREVIAAYRQYHYGAADWLVIERAENALNSALTALIAERDELKKQLAAEREFNQIAMNQKRTDGGCF